MLLPESQLTNTPVMSLHTGTQVARLDTPVIDPTNLKIIAYKVKDIPGKKSPSFLLIDDIREMSALGMIIDNTDDLIELGDVIKIDNLNQLDFQIRGKSVVEELGRKIGKVEDYSIETSSFMVHKLHVKQGLLKSFGATIALIDRSQIVEVNDHSILVKTTAKRQPVEAERVAIDRPEYVNPFRKPANSPQPETRQL